MMSQRSVLSYRNDTEIEKSQKFLAENLVEMTKLIDFLENNFFKNQNISDNNIDFQLIHKTISDLQNEISFVLKESENRKRESDRAYSVLLAVTEGRVAINEQLEQLRPLADRASFAENRLRQKEEEVDQAQSEQMRQKVIADDLGVEVNKLRKKLDEANQWVFNLAGHRKELETAIDIYRRKLDRARALLTAEQAKVARLDDRLSERDIALALQEQDLERLSKHCRDLEELPQNISEEASAGSVDPVKEYQSTFALRQYADEYGLANHAKGVAEFRARHLAKEVEILTAMLLERDGAVQKYSAKNVHLAKEASHLLERLRVGDEDRERLLMESQHRSNEIQHLVRDLRFSNEQREQEVRVLERLAAISDILMKDCPFWWFLMPASWRMKQKYKVLRREGLFDPASYYEMHKDVATSGLDALQHYIRHGIGEGRACPATAQ